MGVAESLGILPALGGAASSGVAAASCAEGCAVSWDGWAYEIEADIARHRGSRSTDGPCLSGSITPSWSVTRSARRADGPQGGDEPRDGAAVARCQRPRAREMGHGARDAGDGGRELGLEARVGGEILRALGEDGGFVNEKSRFVRLESRFFREVARLLA